jgi:hypothetical protein
MTTSPTPTFLVEILSGGAVPLAGSKIPRGKRAYFQERLKGRAYDLVVNEFLRQCDLDSTLTQAAVARRLEKRPEQINRWLAGPGNWTLETLSDLLLAICGGEPTVGVSVLRRSAEEHASSVDRVLSERDEGVTQASVGEPAAAEEMSRAADQLNGGQAIMNTSTLATPLSKPRAFAWDDMNEFAPNPITPANSNHPASELIGEA